MDYRDREFLETAYRFSVWARANPIKALCTVLAVAFAAGFLYGMIAGALVNEYLKVRV